MKIETEELDAGSLRLTLSREEVRYLALALERATFQDTPPQYQRSIYNFAEDLLRMLEAHR